MLKKQQENTIKKRRKENRHLDENHSLMQGIVSEPQQITSGIIKQAKSVENLQGKKKKKMLHKYMFFIFNLNTV